jgi:hypothetical protein
VISWDTTLEMSFRTDDGTYTRSPLGRLRWWFGSKRHHYLAELKESHFQFDPLALERRGDFYVTSYWQSPLYFDDIADQIRSDLRLRSPLSAVLQSIKDHLEATSCSVAFIVRRGDFANHPRHSKFHGSCSFEYYRQAVDIIKSRVADPHFFVFSDDVSWVRSNFEFECPVTFMDQPYDHAEYDYVDMHLISCCRHHIIANSTFGWWGAWLGSSVNGVVIAPQRWFLDESINTQDVVPEHWIRL